MQKIYVLEGLDCANCAMKIERQVAKVKGVQETNVDFVTKKLYVEYEDATIEEAILSTVTSIEPLLTSSAPNDTAPSHASSLAVLKAPGEHAASISRSRSDDEGTLSATARASSALRSLESPLRPSSRPTPSSSVFVYSPRHASSVPAGSRSRARSRRMASFCSKRPSSHASKRSSKAAARSASVMQLTE